MLGVCSRHLSACGSEKTETIRFTSDSIRYDFDTHFIFEQDGEIYTLVWKGKTPADFVVLADAVAPMIEEEELTLTVEPGVLTSRKYVVDVRSADRVYFDLAVYNQYHIFCGRVFTGIGVGFTLLNLAGHVLYIELMTGVLSGLFHKRRKTV